MSDVGIQQYEAQVGAEPEVFSSQSEVGGRLQPERRAAGSGRWSETAGLLTEN